MGVAGYDDISVLRNIKRKVGMRYIDILTPECESLLQRRKEEIAVFIKAVTVTPYAVN